MRKSASCFLGNSTKVHIYWFSLNMFMALITPYLNRITNTVAGCVKLQGKV